MSELGSATSTPMNSSASEGSNSDVNTSGEGHSNDNGDDDDFVETRFEKLNEKRRQEQKEKREKGFMKKAVESDRESGREEEESDDEEDDSPRSREKVQEKPPVKKEEKKKSDDDDFEELVIDGKAQKFSRADLKKMAQKAHAADQRFMEASKIKKQAEQVMKLLKENPWEVLGHPSMLGESLREKAEELVYERLQWDSMSEGERKAIENEKKLKKYEEQETFKRQEEETRQVEAAKKHYTENFHKEIIGVLETADLPKNPNVVKKMAHYMLEARKRGFPAKAGDVVDLVREDLFGETNPIYRDLEGEKLVKALGPDVADKVRKYYLEQARNNGAKFSTPSEQNPLKEVREVKNPRDKKESVYEFRARMERIKQGLE